MMHLGKDEVEFKTLADKVRSAKSSPYLLEILHVVYQRKEFILAETKQKPQYSREYKMEYVELKLIITEILKRERELTRRKRAHERTRKKKSEFEHLMQEHIEVQRLLLNSKKLKRDQAQEKDKEEKIKRGLEIVATLAEQGYIVEPETKQLIAPPVGYEGGVSTQKMIEEMYAEDSSNETNNTEGDKSSA